MPANLTPDYKAAEAVFRRARDPAERLEALREMMRLIPKHKGTEHLRADIKKRIKELTEELAGPRKGAARTGPPTVIRPEGAAQVALVGPPNAGKSALHAALTRSHAVSEPYPFATQYPLPGMLVVDDTSIQLVDLPSVSSTHPIPWIGNALQPADAVALVVDLAAPGCVEQVWDVHEVLAARRVFLVDDTHEEGEDGDPFARYLPVSMIASKIDLLPKWEEELAAFRELTGYAYPARGVSVESGAGLDELGPWLYDRLGIVRVYTKAPGRPPDRERPFTLRRGGTVADLAALIHKDLARNLRFARLWNDAAEGRQVGRDHRLADGDIVELHT